MSRPNDLNSLLELVRRSGLVDAGRLNSLLSAGTLPADLDAALAAMVKAGLLTPFHTRHLREGKSRGFLLGPYRVLRPLGRGGMGLVYLAEQTSINRRVAVKVLRTQMHQTAGARERFAREGRATAALDHPNIVRIYDVQQDGDVHFMVMEYVEGKSLSKLLREQGRMTVSRAVDVVRQAAAGLQHAHERGIIHRDLKPANLLVDRAGTVKLLDMGLARFYEDSADNLTERIGGGILGSPDIIAPEQANNQADIRSDVYALGATFYCLLLGEPPFPAATAGAKVMAHQTKPVTPPHVRDPGIPPEVSAVVLKMLAKSADDRYQSAAEVMVALSVFREAPKPARPVPRRRGWLLILAVAGAAALGGALAWWLAGMIR
ncbi:MAG: serine/threonine-protein kinase [Gemmataceae bacterium]